MATMIVCPVCEYSQDVGFECDVCGRDLSAVLGDLGAPPITIEKMGELEVTIPDRVGEVALEVVADLEANRAAPVLDVPLDVTPDLEASAQAPVGDVAVERIGDLTDDRVADDGVRTAAPTGAVTCRYCRNVQQAGTLCEKCGMKLPGAGVTGPETRAPLSEWTRCKACGAPAVVGLRCTDCGQLVPHPDA